jgi:nucleotide-binding universal stress UspA family protein
MKQGMKILVAYDGSDHADKAVKEAIDIATCFKASIELVHISWKQSVNESRALLKTKEAELKEAGITYNLKDERGDDPGPTLVRLVEDDGFDLIVMGTRGMSTVRTIILGSVSSHIIEKVDIPVVIVK